MAKKVDIQANKTLKGLAKRAALAQLGEETFETACAVMEGATWTEDTVECASHDGFCELCAPPPPAAFSLEIAGTACWDFSAISSKKEMMAGESIFEFVIWAYRVKCEEPKAIIHECVPFFKV